VPSYEVLIAFFVTTAVFAYIPGPAMLYAAAQTVARGRTAGLMASLGIHVGCYVHVIAAAAGLSVLFHAVPVLYLAVKIAGAAYLVWLGILMFRARQEEPETAPRVVNKTASRAFLESITVEVLNPKTAIFFVAFLPQFIDPAATAPIWLQFVILGTLVNLMFSSADVVVVLLAGLIAKGAGNSATVRKIMQRLGGCLMIGLGVRLALDRS
jgi:threonine/homoserine/homoserine lactone efflux protein